MADRFDILKKILKGGSASYKVPTERPGIKAQKKAFDSFQRASSALYQQSLVGGVERLERVKDYEEMDHYPEITRALDIYADDSMTYAEDGKIMQIISDDDKIIHELEELLLNNFHSGRKNNMQVKVDSVVEREVIVHG